MAGKRRPKKNKRKTRRGNKKSGRRQEAVGGEEAEEVPPLPPLPPPVPALPTFKVTPPPIYIDWAGDFKELFANLERITGTNQFSMKVTSVHSILMTKSPGIYKEIVEYLKATADYRWHTFMMRGRKPLRVVVRGLGVGADIGELDEELRSRGFLPRAISPVAHPVTGAVLPLYFVDLEPGALNRSVYDVKTVLGGKAVRVERPRPRQEVVQCHRCQRLGHTRNYCGREERCVKCAGPHDWRRCTKPRNVEPTCANCTGRHTASWRGCPIYREARARRIHQCKSAAVQSTIKKLLADISLRL